MSSTLEILTALQEQFKGWNVDGPRGLLYYLNVAHKLFRQCEAEQIVYYDATTGKLPYLDTVTGTFQYDLPDNCWKLWHVLVEAGVTGSLLDNWTGADYGLRIGSPRKIEPVTIAGIDYLRVHNIRSWPCTESAVAQVVFTDDPGTTDDIYNIAYYKKPAEILSSSIQIEVEPPWDDMYLVPAVCRLIEGIQHGNYADARNEVMNHWRNLYWKELNKGEQGFYAETEDRGY